MFTNAKEDQRKKLLLNLYLVYHTAVRVGFKMYKRQKTRERVRKHRLIRSALANPAPPHSRCGTDEIVSIIDEYGNVLKTTNHTINDNHWYDDVIPTNMDGNCETPQRLNDLNTKSGHIVDYTPEHSDNILFNNRQDDPEIQKLRKAISDYTPEHSENIFNNSQDDPEIQELRKWAVICNIPLAHLDLLLKILRKRLLPTLPKCGKTFLNTSQAVYKIQPMNGANNTIGEYVYLGIEQGLVSCIDPNVYTNDIIFLQINVDGASPYKSSSKQLWPILCKVIFEPDIYSPFPVALYYGETKPDDVNQFMDAFIEEINLLQKNGICVDDKKYDVQLKHIICDIPARKFLKQTKGHGGYAACERCDVYGERVGFPNPRVVYPNPDCQERSDESFREQQQVEHHTGVSPLLRIEPPIDMIYSFPLDYMHLCCLGITKKFYVMHLIFKTTAVKLNLNLRRKLFARITYLNPFTPAEFQRKPRIPVPNLKASELRFIALYAGPIIFKGILSSELYNHFLLFHTAFRILCMKGFATEFNNFAKSYLATFFSLLPKFYGETSHVLNAHYLLHLADDVRINQCTLNEISAFPFENHLGKTVKSLRTANKPLAQICRRIHENKIFATKPTIPPRFTILKQKKTNDDRKLLVKLRYENFLLTKKTPNDLVMLNNGMIIKITSLGYATEFEGDIQLTGLNWMKKKSIFEYPTNSADLYMWQLKSKPSRTVVEFKLEDIQFKMVQMRVPYQKNGNELEQIYAVPLLH